MGTSQFGVPALRSLISNHQVVAVFTQIPKSKGRGLKLTSSPIHEIAAEFNIATHTPNTLRAANAFELVASIEADLIVVCSYGFIIPKNILESKKYGCLNIHPSLLPKYRGAAPLQRAIINGDEKTAVCIMQMDEGLDTGPVLLQKDLSISDAMSIQELHDECAEIGGKLLLEVIQNIDNITPKKQSEEGESYARKLSKEEARIDWSMSAKAINCKIRGMLIWPGSYFVYQGIEIKVLKAAVIEMDHNYAPGTVINEKLQIACGKDVLEVQELQKAGSRQLKADEFLRGFAIPRNAGL
jgi:methionyl-tRNA formyltransferase